VDHGEFLRFISPLGGVPFSKFIVLPQTEKTDILWTVVYPFHFHFVTQVLLAGKRQAPGSDSPSRDGGCGERIVDSGEADRGRMT
jgi:hypothetical protein